MMLTLTSWRALRAMSLHVDMRVEMVEGSIRLLAPVEAAWVEPLDLVKRSPRTLLDCVARERDEGIRPAGIIQPGW